MFIEGNATGLGMIDAHGPLVFISIATVCCVLPWALACLCWFSCVTLMFLKPFLLESLIHSTFVCLFVCFGGDQLKEVRSAYTYPGALKEIDKFLHDPLGPHGGDLHCVQHPRSFFCCG